MLGWIPRSFKIFIFKPKLLFLREITKMVTKGKFLDFYEFTL